MKESEERSDGCCSDCGGSGWAAYEPCSDCLGTGHCHELTDRCPPGRCGYTWVTSDQELHECLFRHVDGWHLCDCGVRTSPVVVGEQGPELAYPPNDEANDADLIAFLERGAARGETE
jgi:hypothetical protein